MKRRPPPTPHRLFMVTTRSRLRLWAPIVASVILAAALVVAAPSHPAPAPAGAATVTDGR